MGLKELGQVLTSSLRTTTANVTFVIAMAAPFAWLMSYENIPVTVAELLLSLFNNPIIILLILNLLLLVIGALKDTTAAMIILSGVLTTVGQQLGMPNASRGACCHQLRHRHGHVAGRLLAVRRNERHRSPHGADHNQSVPLILFIVMALVTYVPTIIVGFPNLIM